MLRIRGRGRRFAVVASIATATFWIAPGSALAAHRSGTTGSRSTPPTVSISSPTGSSTAGGTVSVAGAASDAASVTSVAVAVDSGAWQAAAGTTKWSWSWNSASVANGTHTLSAKATDSAGLTTTVSESVTVSNTSSGGSGGSSGTVISNPQLGDSPINITQGRMAESGTVEAALYRGRFNWSVWADFRNTSTGSSSEVNLPYPSSPSITSDWTNVSYALNGLTDLWTFDGGGPVVVRHYSLSGSPLPTSATLISTTTFGDTDSVAGDLIRLASGALVLDWAQSGINNTPQGYGVAYLSPSGTWSTTYPLPWSMASSMSLQRLSQQPADGSIWLFSVTDGWGAIGAAHFTESPSGLAMDWGNTTFISQQKYGANGPDGELPDIEAAADATAGTIDLAYESAQRQACGTSVGSSYPVVARIPASGSPNFVSQPTYVERRSSLGLIVKPNQLWLAYRPVDPSTCSITQLSVDQNSSGVWGPATSLGQVATSSTAVGFGINDTEFAANMSDSQLHLFFP